MVLSYLLQYRYIYNLELFIIYHFQKELCDWAQLQGHYIVRSLKTEVERVDGFEVSDEQKSFGEQKTVLWLEQLMMNTQFELDIGTNLEFAISTYPEFVHNSTKVFCSFLIRESYDACHVLTDFSFQKISDCRGRNPDFFGEEFVENGKLIDKRYTRERYCYKCDTNNCNEDNHLCGQIILHEDIYSFELERNGNLVWHCSEEYRFKGVQLKIIFSIQTDRLKYCGWRDDWFIQQCECFFCR
jgi:hypothetical protein